MTQAALVLAGPESGHCVHSSLKIVSPDALPYALWGHARKFLDEERVDCSGGISSCRGLKRFTCLPITRLTKARGHESEFVFILIKRVDGSQWNGSYQNAG